MSLRAGARARKGDINGAALTAGDGTLARQANVSADQSGSDADPMTAAQMR